MKRRETIYKIANGVIRVLLILIISGLCLQSMFSTSFLGYITKEDGSLQQRTLNIPDSPARHLMVLLFCIAALVLGARLWQHIRTEAFITGIEKRLTVSAVLKILCVLTGIAGCVWILATQLRPASDPVKVYECAIQWRENNFSSFAEGGYLFRYPFQSGMVLFYYLLSFLLGIDNYLGLQLINAAALVVIYYLLAKLAGLYWQEDKKIQVIVYVALALWAPFFFYVTYLYGIMPGMACSLAAVYMTFRYLDKRQYRYMLLAALFIGTATVFKMNCLIYLVAVSCFLVYDIVVTSEKRNKLRSLLFIILMIVSVKGLNQAVYSYVEHLSGYEMPDGEVMVSWVVMGLSDTPIGPGHYSGYIGDVFIQYHYDTEKITEASIADIKKIMTRMIENPHDEALPFFAKKNAFQWNDPTFIGMKLTDARTSEVTMADWVQSVINGSASVRLSVFLNDAQTQILFGALFCLLLRFKSKNLYELFGGVIFLGGYLFHFFWESSSSYTIPYFVILIPYAVKGWLDAVRSVDNALAQYQAGRNAAGMSESEEAENEKAENEKAENKKAGNENAAGMHRSRRRMFRFAAAFACVILFAAFTRTNLFHNTIYLNDGEDAKNQFYHIGWEEEQDIENGYYLISPDLDNTLVLKEAGGRIEAVPAADKIVCEEDKIAVVIHSGKAVLRFRGSEQVLAVLEEEPDRPAGYMDDRQNMFYDFTKKADYQWELEPAGENAYYIVMNGQALTYDAAQECVSLEAFERQESQKWLFRVCE